jgi:class 3 adenylate cyclase
LGGGRFDDRVRDLLGDARTCIDAGDWEGARGLLTAALALDADDADARRLLDRVHQELQSDGERRQLTVMFCDVVGSTALSHDRDPELLREVLRTYQVTCDESVRRYEGRIARFVGDGILAYFGHPVAHEDDARRAVKAGLDLLEALRPVTEEMAQRYDIDLAVRVAVHTGVVVLADMGSTATPDRDAIVGETPNLAARLQDHTRPGTLVISQDTYELVRGWFLVAPLGEVALKGIAKPIAAYEVVEETAIESRVQAQVDLSPFVGRTEQLELLHQAWEEVRLGGHRSMVLTGQAGVGKSRLADVMRRRALADEGGALIANCSTYHGTTTLFPVRRLLEQAAGLDTRQDADHALPRLWNVMEAVGQAASVPLLADLLEIPPTTWSPAPELDGSKLHDAILNALVDFVAATAARAPMLLVVDDVQWADTSTLELVGRLLAARVPGLLFLITARDEFRPPWSTAEPVPIDRLSTAELDALAQRLPEGRRLGRVELDQAIERSDGIPFFLEELLRGSVLTHVTGEGRTDANIPSGLRDLLLARFAAPGVDLRVAQQVATVGGDATSALLAACLSCAPAEVGALLRPMVDAGILLLVEGEPDTYRFRHHLLGDLAYDTQLRPARERAHGAVADALRSGASVGVTAAPAVVARHLERAGRTAEAVEALLEATGEAFALGATGDAAGLLERGFELLDSVPGERRADLELELRLLRGTMVSSTMGFSAPQAIADFEACQALVQGAATDGYLDDRDEKDARREYDLVASTTALWANLLLQGRIDDAETINRALIARFRPGGFQRAFVESGGDSLQLFFRGDYDRVGRASETFVAFGRDAELPGRNPMPNDPRLSCIAHLSFVRSAQGRLDEARALSDEGVQAAVALAFPVGPFTTCYLLGMRAAVELGHGYLSEADRFAAQLSELAERHGFTFWSLLSGLYGATVDFASGDDAASQRATTIASMLRAMGMLVWMPSFLAAIAAVHLRRGDLEGAAPLLLDAAEVAEQTGVHYWSAEITRQRGELALAQGNPAGVDLLRDAVALAERQGAKLLELWASTSLCRHSDDPADGDRLGRLLAEITLPTDAPDRLAAEAVLADRG